MYNSDFDNYVGYWATPPSMPPPGPQAYDYSQAMPHPSAYSSPMNVPPSYSWNCNSVDRYAHPDSKMANIGEQESDSKLHTKRNYEEAFNELAENTEEEFSHVSADTDEDPGIYSSPLVPRGREMERPSTWKKSGTSSYAKWTLELDPNLPEDIAALHKIFKCDLCSVKLSSRIQAKAHYDGKPHAKKLKNELEKRQKDNAEGPTVTIKETPTKKKKSVTDGSQLYCKCCDLSFTSTEHATQHYLGRNHQRVLHGFKPLKAGYYNSETGNWQRMPLDPAIAAERSEKNATDPDSVKGKGKFFCELCGVSATSQDQLDGHLTGQRHKKTLEMNANNKSKNKPSQKDSILESIIKGDDTNKARHKDFSIYRTPSGKYYCSPCDTTMNSESQCALHVESKKHLLKKK